MSEELGKLLKNAFLNRKTGGTAADTGSNTELLPGERRDVAVLFLDLSGFTAFSETLDHETVHEITRSLSDELVFTSEQYSGYVNKIEDDRIMVLFGAIRSRENNSRSAILCSFKMLSVVEAVGSILSEAGVHLSARIGINSGPVTVAPDAIEHLTAMGRTVNIASRVEENAEENSILVTDSVYSNCSESILWEKPVKLSIRGGVEFPWLAGNRFLLTTAAVLSPAMNL
jgi:class 3 adenylate cyclase